MIRLTLSILALFLASGLAANSPAGTYTFVSPCLPFATYTPVPNTYGCYSFTATNAGAADPNGYYSWDFGDGTVATGSLLLHCYNPVTVTTVYTVTLWYNSAAMCGPQPMHSIYTFTLDPPPSTLCVIPSPSITLAAPSVTVWFGTAIPEIFHQIDFGDGTAPQVFINHTYENCGNYIIRMKTWNLNDTNSVCYAYAALNLTCAAGPPPPPTGIEDYANAKASDFFPNPSTGIFHIKSSKAMEKLSIRDICGKKISEHPLNANYQQDIDISELTNGTYFVEIAFTDGTSYHAKLVKI